MNVFYLLPLLSLRRTANVNVLVVVVAVFVVVVVFVVEVLRLFLLLSRWGVKSALDVA